MIWLVVLLALAAGGIGTIAVAPAVLPKAQWVTSMYNAVSAELPQLGGSARLLVVAHAAYESGWGTARAAAQGFNVFNLTAGSAWSGPVSYGPDTEYDAQGRVTAIGQTWRVYGSLREAVADYWRFLGPSANRGRYVTARAALERGDLEAFARELYAAGYFTLPPDRYIAGLSAVLSQVRGIA